MFLWLLLGVAAATAAFCCTTTLGDPSPLGVPLPEVPQLFEILPHDDAKNMSVVERRLPEVMLEFLAEQPDGAPPVRFTVRGEFIDFSIGHLSGIETTAFPVEETLKDNVIISGVVHFDQPLKALQYSAPGRREGESLTEYTSRLRYEMEKKGAVYYENVEPLPLEGYRFEHFEYKRENENGEMVSHYLFIGPLGTRALVMDYMTTPELHERARPWVMKMIRTFKTGRQLQETVLESDPEYIALNELDEPGS
jgi:hypothetical protein